MNHGLLNILIEEANIRLMACDTFAASQRVEKSLKDALELYEAGLITWNETLTKAKTGN